MTLIPGGVVDVGTASALGANKILHGQSLYYPSVGHPDTYGPIDYLVYVPFLALSWHVSWSYLLPRARGDDHVRPADDRRADLAGHTAARRSRRMRLGLLLAWLWAACPFSVLDMEKSTNDRLVALIVVLSCSR